MGAPARAASSVAASSPPKPTAGSLAPAGRDVPSEAILLINGGDAETQRSHVLKWA